jgi:hypothetical protein
VPVEKERAMNRLALCILLLVLPLGLFSFQNEPNGFRGVNWWSPVPSSWVKAPAPEDLPINSPYESCWKNPKDELKIGDARVEEVVYLARGGRICAVYIKFNNLAVPALKKSCTAKFGSPTDIGSGATIFLLWKGQRTVISLYFNPSEQGTLCLRAADWDKKGKEEAGAKTNTKGF